MLAVAMGVGTVGGFYADRWLDTSPWLTLLGIVLGMTGGLTSVVRTVLGGQAKTAAGQDGGKQPGGKKDS